MSDVAGDADPIDTHYDPSTNQHYFMNRRTSQSAWTAEELMGQGGPPVSPPPAEYAGGYEDGHLAEAWPAHTEKDGGPPDSLPPADLAGGGPPEAKPDHPADYGHLDSLAESGPTEDELEAERLEVERQWRAREAWHRDQQQEQAERLRRQGEEERALAERTRVEQEMQRHKVQHGKQTDLHSVKDDLMAARIAVAESQPEMQGLLEAERKFIQDEVRVTGRLWRLAFG
jgi:hypothetical protein